MTTNGIRSHIWPPYLKNDVFDSKQDSPSLCLSLTDRRSVSW